MEEGWFKNYPVDAINWDDSLFTPVEKAKKIYGEKFCIIGGIDRKKALLEGTPRQVEEAVKDAIERAGRGGGFIVGPGCTLNANTPLENYNAVARAVEKYGRYKS